MDINISFIYTPEALSLKSADNDFGQWPLPTMSVVPLAGDLISFGGDDTPVFEVRNRLFMWKTHQQLDVQLLLGAAPVPPEGLAANRS